MLVPTETIHTSTEASFSASLTITPVTEAQARRVARQPGEWSTDDLYQYVAEECARLNGPQLPAKGAQSVIEDFCRRYGIATAVRIARAAFELYGGKWQGAPITWRRFAPAHDEFFAQGILAAMLWPMKVTRPLMVSQGPGRTAINAISQTRTLAASRIRRQPARCRPILSPPMTRSITPMISGGTPLPGN